MLGHWSLFFFYPADFTFVCPTELEDLARNYAKFKEIGCEIYSVSCDTHFVHKAWHDANEKIAKIQYPMLADPTALLAKDLDTYNEVDGMAERGDFIVSPEGKVVAYEVISSNVAAMPKNCYAVCKLLSSSTNMAIRFALPTGLQARTPLNLALILLVNCDRRLTDGLSS